MTLKYSYPIEASTINGWGYPVTAGGDPDSDNLDRVTGDNDLYLYFGSSGGADGCLFADTEKRALLTTGDVGPLAADVADTGQLVGELLGAGCQILPEELVTLITTQGMEARRILAAIQG